MPQNLPFPLCNRTLVTVLPAIHGNPAIGRLTPRHRTGSAFLCQRVNNAVPSVRLPQHANENYQAAATESRRGRNNAPGWKMRFCVVHSPGSFWIGLVQTQSAPATHFSNKLTLPRQPPRNTKHLWRWESFRAH